MSRRELKLYIEDINQAITKIDEYTKDILYVNFEEDTKTIDAVVRNLEIIGEAAKNLSPNLKEKYPEIPWAEIIGMRNKIIHEYFGIDTEILWQTIRDDLPKLKILVSKISII